MQFTDFELLKLKSPSGLKSPVFSRLYKSIILKTIKSTTELFPDSKTRLVEATKNDNHTSELCCRFELMDRENAPK